MIWLAWRQHRLALAAAAAVCLAATTYLLVLGSQLRGGLSPLNAASCLGSVAGCGEWESTMAALHGVQADVLRYAPALLGVFVGAPMLARELEQRTLRYAWTQSVSRTHWLNVKILLPGAALLLLSLVFSAACMWFFAPAADDRTWFQVFDAAPPVFAAKCLFSYALGVLAGLVLPRLLSSMALALAGFLAVVVPLTFWVRFSYLEPLRAPTEVYLRSGGMDGWLVGRTFTGPSGGEMSMQEAFHDAGIPASQTGYSTESLHQLERAGFTEVLLYQPADRFWTFQLIETGVLAVLAAACVWATYRLLRRRAV